MREDTRQRLNRILNILVIVLAFSIPLYRKWVSIAAPLIMILWFAEGRLPEKLAALRRHRLTLAAAVFAGFALLSVTWSGDKLAGLAYVDKYRYLLLIPMLATAIRPETRRRAELAFFAGAALSVLLSWAVFLDLVRLRNAYPGNPAPSMSHLDYSMVLAVAGLMALVRLLSRQPLQQRIGWTALLGLVVSGLAINIGRSGQLAFVGSALVITSLVLSRRSWRAAAVGFAVVIAIVAASYAVVEPLRLRMTEGVAELEAAIATGDYESNQGKRIAGAIVALDMVRQRPLLGTGVGGTMDQFRQVLERDHPELAGAVAWFPHLHNQYLQTLAETGFVGMATLLAMMAALALGPYPEPADRQLATILALAYLLGFFGDPFLHKQIPLVLFATMAGLASARGRSLQEPASPPSGGRLGDA